ncbi:TRAP transporter fused permease subunit [Nitratireductor aquimarinus]|uniref:TRAP transporter fused permease subunit n=1 Tax=Nitratireductor aquimarinus TaxID=889300 RepID=A0ABU4AGC2_9HYPH|nr:TRAP transporter fused permease subunit [Nitratireductor aquimarinus]MDV6225300.1 TRAP transporter fused permease subunit [Nitratireductor aquimarinus]
MGFTDKRLAVISALAVLMMLFHLAAASPFWIAPNFVLRGVHLLFAVIIGVLLFPSKSRLFPRWVDAALMFVGVICIGYAVVNHQAIAIRPPWTLEATPFELFVALGTIGVVLEVTRRSLGMTITGLCIAFIIYAFVGPYLRFVDWLRPLAHRGVGINEFVDQMYFSFEGIFGTALGVSAEYIFLFVMFGAILQVAGGGDFFINLTRAATGASRGGPAKMAVVASGLMGMMSGSSVANVATTGSLTIPMMKKLGYPARFAGAVEAIASTGGQITPPIMGAAAFLMAAILGRDYLEVASAALVPALLFFAALLIAVHMMALKSALRSLDAAERGSTWRTLKAGWTFLIPVIVIIGMMMSGYTASFSAFFGVLTTLAVPFLRKATFVSAPRLIAGIRLGVEGAVVVAAACASAGIIVGIVQISGLGFRFSALVTDIAGNNLDLALVLAMLASFIFGMGMPTTPAYIVQATLVAPVLIKLGADPMAAHLFVFFYAVLGQITPPLAVAAYAAAPIAEETPSRVGWSAFALGIPVYIIPFLFVANPELLNPEFTLQFVGTILRSFLAISALSIMMVGWFMGMRLNLIGRGALLVVAAMMIHPGLITSLAGVGVFVALGLAQWQFARTRPAAAEGET